MEMRNADARLVQIVDAALADSARRSGEWLACKPGCTQCCVGAFAIDQLDAMRLREGLKELSRSDPDRASRVRQRAAQFLEKFAAEFPGDPVTGQLEESDEGQRRFEAFANEEPCPALDRVTGLCDLYAARPITCRVFGPPVRSEGGLGVCELCFHGASDEEIARCEMHLEQADAERERLLEGAGFTGETIVAFAVR